MAFTESDISRFGPKARKQIAEQLGKAETKKLKYNNRPTERLMPNGKTHRFPSEKEAARYDELAAMLKLGVIRNLKLQPEFTITEGFIASDGTRVRAHRYTADFSYEEMKLYWEGYENECPYPEGWTVVVEDVKGGKATKTRDYINNKKALADRGIFVREV